MTTTQTTAGPSTAPSSSSPKDVQDPAAASSSCRAAAGETGPAAPLSPRTRGRKGLPLPSYYRVAITDQLHARPELRGCFPLADAIDTAGRWCA